MFDDEGARDDFVHGLWFGERQGLAHEASIGLSQSVIPTFHMISLPFTFSDALVCLGWEDQWISIPQIAETLTAFITGRDPLPEKLTSLLASITDGISNDLACVTAHRCPNPAFLPVFQHKGPHFVDFQNILRLGWQQCLFKFWILLVFFWANSSAYCGWDRRSAECHAYWSVRWCRQPEFVLFVRHYNCVSVPGHHACHSLCTRIVGCHTHCDRSWQYFGCRSFDNCTRLFLRS